MPTVKGVRGLTGQTVGKIVSWSVGSSRQPAESGEERLATERKPGSLPGNL